MPDLNFVQRIVIRKETNIVISRLNSLKWTPSIVAAAGIVYEFEKPALVAYMTAHPHTFVAVVLAAIIAAYHSPSPHSY